MPEITELVQRLLHMKNGVVSKCKSKTFAYNGLSTAIKAKTIFKEKIWHAKRYPNINIKADACNGCGKCASACPVLHLLMQNGSVVKNPKSPCIHCFNCAIGCPHNAIEILG